VTAVYLVDTDVVSAGAPSRKPPPLLVAWMDENSAHLYVSAVSIAEIEAGIARLRRLGARRRADYLTAWLDTLLHLYAEHVLPFEVRAARIAGSLADRARGTGHGPGFAAVAIAATAQLRGLTILTRNARHFEPLGVPFQDPFLELPPRRPTPAQGDPA
jgi:predicted nucleic acid-binding protein